MLLLLSHLEAECFFSQQIVDCAHVSTDSSSKHLPSAHSVAA